MFVGAETDIILHPHSFSQIFTFLINLANINAVVHSEN